MESTVPERPYPELPEAVIAVVLDLLPTRNRLTSALVSRTWAAAAAATLPAADLQAVLRPDDSSCQALDRFLQQHAGRICSMQLTSSKADNNKARRPLLRLPPGLTQLCSLSARRLELDLQHPSTGTSSTAAAQRVLLPQLRSIKLQQCMMASSSLEALPALQSLTSLHIHELHVTSARADWLSTTLSQVLQQLPALTDVGLGTSATYITPLHVQFPADRPDLQRGTLGGAFARGTLAGLPASLTFLHLQPSGRSRCLRVDAGADQLAQLSNLQHLQLSKAEFPAELLAQMTTVQRVTLVGAWAAAPFPEPLWQDMTAQLHLVHPLPVTSSRVRDLMAAMIHLPQLQHLECRDMNDSSVPCMLRALTQLTALEITEQGMPTECGVLQRVLLQLPQMRSLRLVAAPQQSGARRSYSWDHRDKPSCLNGSDMRNIVDSFRNLEHLSLLGVVGPSVFAGCLANLSCLQSLCVSGPAFKDCVAAAVARMTGLKSLQWSDSDTLTVAGLRRLTALSALSRLEVASCPGLPLGAPAHSVGRAQLLLQCTQEGEPDVWRRLQWWCRHLQEREAKHKKPACRRSSSSSKADSEPLRDQQPRRTSSSGSDGCRSRAATPRHLSFNDQKAGSKDVPARRSATWR